VQPRGQGFTLIELLVVITIIMILAGILFPVYARTRERAYQVQCTSQLKQLYVSMRMYADDNAGRYPKGRAVTLKTSPVEGNVQYTGTRYPGNVYTVLYDNIREERLLKCPTGNTEWWYTYRACGEAYEFSYPYNGLCWRRWSLGGVRDSDVWEASKQVLLTEGYHLWFNRHETIYDRLGSGFFLGNPQYKTDWHNGRVNVLWGDGHVDSKRLDQLWYYNFYRNSRNLNTCGPKGVGDCMRPITDGY